MSSGRNTPRPPPSIIAGPPMPMLASRVAMIVSQHPSSAALPAKQRPAAIPTVGTSPDRRAKSSKARVSSPAMTGMSVSPGPAAATFGEEHDRQPQPLGELEDAVLLGVVALSLGAGEHGVVVGHHRACGALDADQLAVDACRAGDEPVSRSVGLEVGALAASLLGCEGEPAVLLERPGVAQRRDVLPGGSLAAAVPLRHGVGSGGVGEERPGPFEVRQVRSVRGARVLVGRVDRGAGARRGQVADELLDLGQQLAGGHRVPHLDAEARDATRCARCDRMLHLHHLEQHHRGPGGHPLTHRARHCGDRRRHGCLQPNRAAIGLFATTVHVPYLSTTGSSRVGSAARPCRYCRRYAAPPWPSAKRRSRGPTPRSTAGS